MKACVHVFVCYLLQANAEASEDLLHVASLLHGDDTQVILLIHPDEEGLVVVVPGGRKSSSLSLYRTRCSRASETTRLHEYNLQFVRDVSRRNLTVNISCM